MYDSMGFLCSKFNLKAVEGVEKNWIRATGRKLDISKAFTRGPKAEHFQRLEEA